MKSQSVAIVTGAGSGIGRSIAVALAKEHYALVLSGRHEATLEETRLLIGQGVPVECVAGDVGNADDVAALFARAVGSFSRVDLLVNNAGVTAPSVALEEISLSQWQQVVDTNLTGAFLCTQQAFRVMKHQDPAGGRIINNGSISAHTPRPNSAPYTATKHAMTGLTKSTSLDGRAFRIACGQIDIGNAATAFTEPMERGILQPSGVIAAEERMNVDDVARAVVYMASLPLEANVLFMTVMANAMPYVGRG